MGKKVYVDLTHPFSAEIPRWPYFDKPEITNAHTMAKGGVLTSKITCTMHTGTHCDAPRHVMEYEFDGRRLTCCPHQRVTGPDFQECAEEQDPDHRQAPGRGLQEVRHRPRLPEGQGSVPEHRHAPPVR